MFATSSNFEPRFVLVEQLRQKSNRVRLTNYQGPSDSFKAFLVRCDPDYFSFLSVQESIVFLCRLLRANPTTFLINRVMSFCELKANQRIAKCSIGQLKLLIITVHLLSEPDLLVLLQPLRHLSTSETFRLHSLLQEAPARCTLLATGDSVNDQFVSIFAQIHLLHQNHLLFSGTLSNLTDLLQSQSLACPNAQHPINFVLCQLHQFTSSNVKSQLLPNNVFFNEWSLIETSNTQPTDSSQPPTPLSVTSADSSSSDTWLDSDSACSPNEVPLHRPDLFALTVMYVKHAFRCQTRHKPLWTLRLLSCLLPIAVYLAIGTEAASQSACSFLYANSTTILAEPLSAKLRRVQAVQINLMFVFFHFIVFLFVCPSADLLTFHRFNRQICKQSRDQKVNLPTAHLSYLFNSVWVTLLHASFAVLCFYWLTNQTHSNEFIVELSGAFFGIGIAGALLAQSLCMILGRTNLSHIFTVLLLLITTELVFTKYLIVSPERSSWLLTRFDLLSPVSNALDITVKGHFHRPHCKVDEQAQFDLDHLLELMNLSLDQFGDHLEPIRDVPSKIKEPLRQNRWTLRTINQLAEAFLDLDEEGMKKFSKFWNEKDNFVLDLLQIRDRSFNTNLAVLSYYCLIMLIVNITLMAMQTFQINRKQFFVEK